MRQLAQWVLVVGSLARGLYAQDTPAPDPDADLRANISRLAERSRKTQEAAIQTLAELKDPRAIPALTALRQSRLYAWTEKEGAEPRLVIVTDRKSEQEFLDDGTELVQIRDAYTNERLLDGDGAALMVEKADMKRARATNSLKRKIDPVLVRLRLSSPDPKARQTVAATLGGEGNAKALPALEAALEEETDTWARHSMDEAVQRLRLLDQDPKVRLAAVTRLREIRGTRALYQLRGMVKPGEDGNPPEADAEVRAAAASAVRALETHRDIANMVGAFFDALSLSSILMLIALGLAITFGVMGVINMAHGEMMMIGAYSAYVVQNVFLSLFSRAWFDVYFLAAFPVSFLAAAGLGLLMEKFLLRFLYRRPLESLLATFGISLMLQQFVRHLFGAANVDVESPSFLAGGIPVMVGLELPYNRLFIVGFSVVCLTAIYCLLWRSKAGLRIRAVTQNRDMSACLGVATRRVDAWTFALGAGVAGMAGCAISQLGNVGPDLGQTYIIDSFMVVVLGGVGKLLGTVLAAVGIGGFNKILESMMPENLSKWGPILAKVAVLALLILFLQKKPSGLFAVKGRHAEA